MNGHVRTDIWPRKTSRNLEINNPLQVLFMYSGKCKQNQNIIESGVGRSKTAEVISMVKHLAQQGLK